MIRKANMNDLKQIDQCAVLTIKDMIQSDISQWDLDYPREKHYKQDVLENGLYVYEEGNQIIGAVAIKKENDAPYKELSNWLEKDSMVIHRLIIHPLYRNKKIAQSFFCFAYELTKTKNCKSIKIDTHQENYKMRSFLTKNGFEEIGYLKSINRLAFEKRV